jgi:glutamate/tyrosine decarboxylase-like PLP-dependent enzyme
MACLPPKSSTFFITLCLVCSLASLLLLLLLLHNSTDLEESKPTGTDTVGSSEAVLLGGLAMKRRWQDRRKAAGLDASRPNIVMGTETHVVGLPGVQQQQQ